MYMSQYMYNFGERGVPICREKETNGKKERMEDDVRGVLQKEPLHMHVFISNDHRTYIYV